MRKDDMILIAPEGKLEGFRQGARAATGAAR